MLRTDIPDHPLLNKFVDLDWRSPKERNLPYTTMDMMIDQYRQVKGAKVDCDGKKWLYFDETLPVLESRICKVHD